MNTSLDRRYSRIHDHLKPNKVCWDDALEVVLKFQEEFQIWIPEVTRVCGADREFVWNSLISLLDTKWPKRMKEDKTLKQKSLEEIFKKMNIILLDRFPLVARRMDHERIKKTIMSFQVPSWRDYFLPCIHPRWTQHLL